MPTKTIPARDLAPGDRLVAAFPRGTTPDLVPSIIDDGWFIVDTEIIDHPAERARHADGQPLTDADVAERIPLTVTYAAAGQTVVTLSVEMPDGTEQAKRIPCFARVLIVTAAERDAGEAEDVPVEQDVTIHLDHTEPGRAIALMSGAHDFDESPQALIGPADDGCYIEDTYGERMFHTLAGDPVSAVMVWAAHLEIGWKRVKLVEDREY